MSEPWTNHKTGIAKGLGRVAVTAIAVPVLYLLSPGPVTFAYQLGFVSEGFITRSAYWIPLDWLCREPAVQDFYDWYLPLWSIGPKPSGGPVLVDDVRF